jgi:hypothetical protein
MAAQSQRMLCTGVVNLCSGAFPGVPPEKSGGSEKLLQKVSVTTGKFRYSTHQSTGESTSLIQISRVAEKYTTDRVRGWSLSPMLPHQGHQIKLASAKTCTKPFFETSFQISNVLTTKILLHLCRGKNQMPNGTWLPSPNHRLGPFL